MRVRKIRRGASCGGGGLFDRRQQLQLQSDEPPWRSNRWCDDVVEKPYWCRNMLSGHPRSCCPSLKRKVRWPAIQIVGWKKHRVFVAQGLLCKYAEYHGKHGVWNPVGSSTINRDMGHLRHHDYSIRSHHIRRCWWVARRRCRPMRRMTLQDYAIHDCLQLRRGSREPWNVDMLELFRYK
ncbi:hypothetical protein IG631_06707 [Alternaria alternata]|nr:hypothetical protein IG631_06707 [Alternaria alternata]